MICVLEEAKEQIRKKKEELLQEQQHQQQQEPSQVVPASQHQYHNPFDHHVYSGNLESHCHNPLSTCIS